MLDAVTYRANEAAAKRAIASWRIANINDPYIFQNQGFPVRADSFLDLAQILDTMHEARFDFYMRELGGLTNGEAESFVNVCLDYIDFYQSVFQQERVVVPLSTMIAHLVIYKKLCGCDPNFGRVLEIGPGCGYLSFFLRNHASLVDYTQIESTESFYLLQSHINSHVFGSRFAERALHPDPQNLHNFHMPKAKWYYEWHYEDQKVLNCGRPIVCNHLPWWRTGDAAGKQYDLVTSNANLNEFSEGALIQYLSLIRDVLKPDGILVSQCLGGGTPTHDRVLDVLHAHDFGTAAVVAGDQIAGKNFCVANGIFVGRGHPLYERFKVKPAAWPHVPRDVEFVNQVLFLNERAGQNRRPWSVAEIMELVAESVLYHRTEGRMWRKTPFDDSLPASPAALSPILSRKSEKPVLAEAVDIVRSLTKGRIARAAENEQGQAQASMSKGHMSEISRLQRVAQIVAHKETYSAAFPADQMQSSISAFATDVETLRHMLLSLRSSSSWRLTAPLRSVAQFVKGRGSRRVQDDRIDTISDIQLLKTKIENLKSSTSWRITAPFRWAKHLITRR